ncbi:LysM peptidoglycan-binding domain-containing protein [Aliikangiella sp. G2MR2-5]|uniref:LysM peptidoglycan-binding domain-containing protein n=1 Tax=Aliikangiella sp. G2MR2-5 TaxID=2788943 RepID=UPI0018AB67A2|nr:LysM peptidoglycan-binding domain-containing protein [Aliikangiella sp. G2MR2-5]
MAKKRAASNNKVFANKIWLIVLLVYMLIFTFIAMVTFSPMSLSDQEETVKDYVRIFEQYESSNSQESAQQFKSMIDNMIRNSQDSIEENQRTVFQSFHIVLGGFLAFLSSTITIVFQSRNSSPGRGPTNSGPFESNPTGTIPPFVSRRLGRKKDNRKNIEDDDAIDKQVESVAVSSSSQRERREEGAGSPLMTSSADTTEVDSHANLSDGQLESATPSESSPGMATEITPALNLKDDAKMETTHPVTTRQPENEDKQSEFKQYTVAAGDTLGNIAARLLGSSARYKEIAELNNLDNPDELKIGQVLKIRVADSTSSSGDKVTATGNGQSITLEQLSQIAENSNKETLHTYIEPLNRQMQKFKINTPLRCAHFLAQLAHESGCFNYKEENLNYSAEALQKVFNKYFPTEELAQQYARQPEKIASRVYANRMKNGDEASGDGWKYRGRGLIQLTGKDNYSRFTQTMKIDFVNNPDWVADNPDYSVAAACWFWCDKNLNKAADKDDLLNITKRINGGTNGLDDRKVYLTKAKAALGIG